MSEVVREFFGQFDVLIAPKCPVAAFWIIMARLRRARCNVRTGAQSHISIG